MNKILLYSFLGKKRAQFPKKLRSFLLFSYFFLKLSFRDTVRLKTR